MIRDLRRYLGYHRSQRGRAIAGSALIVLDTLIAIGLLYLPRMIFDRILPARNFRLLGLSILGISAALAVKELLVARHRILLAEVHNRVVFSLMDRLVEAVYAQAPSFFDKQPAAYVRERILSDAKMLTPVSLSSLLGSALAVLFMLVSFGTVIYLDPMLGGVLVLVMTALAIAFVGPQALITRLSVENCESWALAGALLQSRLAGFKTTFLFGQTQRERSSIASQLSTAAESSIALTAGLESLTRLITVVGSVGLFLLLAAALWEFMSSGLSTGTALVCVGYGTYCINYSGILLANLLQMRATAGPLSRIFQVLDTLPPPPAAGFRFLSPSSKQGVEFENVTFSYQAGTPVLHNVSFTVRPGERVGIIGPSGAGKSTLLSLLAGLYTPDSGRIRVAGVDVTELAPGELRRYVGYLPQDPFLFSGTVRDNIRYSKWQATEVEIRQAAWLASIGGDIDNWPLGYETAIGDAGAGLSGGQRQRLAMARTLLLEPRVFALDEMTSQQDQLNERNVIDTVSRASDGRALIVVTHSLAALDLVDRIIVLEQGRVVCDGTHEELNSSSESYRAMREAAANRSCLLV
jgi:ABC-type bacteriocin/lantibiotic exporter with double-glycine peptidase domain